MKIAATLMALLLAQIQSVESKSYSDETYEKQSLKALSQSSSNSKSYRKKGRRDVKPASASSGEHGGRRFRGEEKIVNRQKPSSEVIIEKGNSDFSQPHEPIFGESISSEKMQHISSDFEKWEMRPVEKDENALAKEEVEMVKTYYEKSQELNQMPLISK